MYKMGYPVILYTKSQASDTVNTDISVDIPVGTNCIMVVVNGSYIPAADTITVSDTLNGSYTEVYTTTIQFVFVKFSIFLFTGSVITGSTMVTVSVGTDTVTTSGIHVVCMSGVSQPALGPIGSNDAIVTFNFPDSTITPTSTNQLIFYNGGYISEDLVSPVNGNSTVVTSVVDSQINNYLYTLADKTAISTISTVVTLNTDSSSESTTYGITFSINGTGSDVPCFEEGTMILTDQGLCEIQNLTDTYSISGVRVKEISKNKTKKQVYRFRKDHFSQGVPDRDTICTGDHKLCIDGKMFCAKDSDIPGIMCKTDKYMYHVLMDNHAWIWMNSNGMLSETMYPYDKI